MRLIGKRLSWRRRERGAVAILMAVGMTMLLVAAAMVLDFGIVRLDRQTNKSTADASTAAGVRGLDGGNGYPYAYKGACKALSFLRLNEPALNTLTWSACSNAALLSKKCIAADATTWARFAATLGRYSVRIESPYSLTATGFAEDSMSILTADQGVATQGGCDQLAVIITQTRKPGLGSLATSSDITTVTRSVGRVIIGADGEGAVGLLSLERRDCQVFNTSGTNAGILVKGFDVQPGVIHSDSLGDGADCNSGNKVLNGNHANGIIAGPSILPLGSLLPGIITTRALSSEAGAVPANATDPIPEVIALPNGTATGRGLLGRGRVDDRYLPGLRQAVTTANALFTGVTAANALSMGYKVINCNGVLTTTTPAQTPITVADKVFVNCAGNPGFSQANVTIAGWRIIFNGKIVSPTNLRMPNATEVYVAGVGNVGVNASGGISMHNYGAPVCGSANSASRARLVVLSGSLEATSGSPLLQLCNTTVIMMGGSNTGCLPATSGTAPTTTPCPGPGNGIVKISGGASQDWTAPNETSNTATQTMWDALEDLALWTETYGSGPDFSMTGGGSMNLAGVFMVPNANPFNIKGGGGQTVENSQYITRKLNVSGNGTLTLAPNPKDVVTFPVIAGFSLVR